MTGGRRSKSLFNVVESCNDVRQRAENPREGPLLPLTGPTRGRTTFDRPRAFPDISFDRPRAFADHIVQGHLVSIHQVGVQTCSGIHISIVVKKKGDN